MVVSRVAAGEPVPWRAIMGVSRATPTKTGRGGGCSRASCATSAPPSAHLAVTGRGAPLCARPARETARASALYQRRRGAREAGAVLHLVEDVEVRAPELRS